MEVTKWLKPSIKSVGRCDRPAPLDFRFTPLATEIARRRIMSRWANSELYAAQQRARVCWLPGQRGKRMVRVS